MVRIRFGTIKIDSLADSSSVNSGINIIIGRSSREETNEGMGSINGKDNRVEAGQHVMRTNRSPGREEA
ncbi:hypothetical protein FE784_11240 [Paenibacillus hemerocallicola]|uniref:Spore germination protein n=1 Tax=Paenibacillus hemerocallicola TaxID=1172614 RepID=A0A5C4TBG0_9BACL|nr:hypothetical protein [Paenibacillus hemerocallicola]TNJ66241.1 hypothetical protein FE784_11240 [Paenibacillus hemerocallicola]